MSEFTHLSLFSGIGGLDQGSWRMGTTGTDVFNWWMEYDVLPGQMDMFEEEDNE